MHFITYQWRRKNGHPNEKQPGEASRTWLIKQCNCMRGNFGIPKSKKTRKNREKKEAKKGGEPCVEHLIPRKNVNAASSATLNTSTLPFAFFSPFCTKVLCCCGSSIRKQILGTCADCHENGSFMPETCYFQSSLTFPEYCLYCTSF